MTAVAEHLRAHMARANEQVLPGLRERCDDEQLARLGSRIEIAREAAPTRPHPGTPTAPPLNKVVDPWLGVVDKLRDVLTRRKTWPQDLVS